jgi:hypothetical protein
MLSACCCLPRKGSADIVACLSQVWVQRHVTAPNRSHRCTPNRCLVHIAAISRKISVLLLARRVHCVGWVVMAVCLLIRRSSPLWSRQVHEQAACCQEATTAVPRHSSEHISPSVVYCLTCLPFDQRFAGSNPAEDDVFLRAIKIRITTSSGGEVKPSVQCKILRHVKDH